PRRTSSRLDRMRGHAPRLGGTRFALPGPMISVVSTPEVDKSWNRFVEQHARATVAHLPVWGETVREVYGHESVYLTARDDEGEIVGVLPLILVQSRLFGRRLVSMPFLDYGGVLAEPERGVEEALVDEALRVARARSA